MPDNFVTVATYTLPYEAELAKSLLQAEGIEAFVAGDLTGGLLPTGEIRLQVGGEDAGRAAAVLAAAEASRDPDWEEQAESGAGVWTCSLCGAPVPEQSTVCDSCGTPRDAIRADRPPLPGDIQRGAPPRAEGIHTRDQVATTPAPPAAPAPAEDESVPGEPGRESPTAAGDELAHVAFVAAVFALLFPPLAFLSWWYLARLFVHSGDLSRAGTRAFYTALACNTLLLISCPVVLFWLRYVDVFD
jgi:hypothetical protein